MSLELKCIAGDLQGKSFAVTEESSIGRSHRAVIRSFLPDVSAIHLLLFPHDGAIEIEVVSTRQTLLNQKYLRQGEKVTLNVGDRLCLGATLLFTVVGELPAKEALPLMDAPTVLDDATRIDGMTKVAVPAQPPAKPEPRVSTPPADDRTAFFDVSKKTRMITPEELRLLSEREVAKKRKQLRFRGMLFSVLGILALSMIIASQWEDTSPLPRVTNVSFAMADAPLGKQTKQLVVNEVPMTITFEVSEDAKELSRTRAASLREWFDAQQKEGHQYEIDETWRQKEMYLLTQRYAMPKDDEIVVEDTRLHRKHGHGLLGVGLRYIHTKPNGERWTGKVILVRKGERRWILTRELPITARDRAKDLLSVAERYFNVCSPSDDLATVIDTYWDFVPNLADNFDKQVVSKRLASFDTKDWHLIEGAILTHLCATQKGTEERKEWERLLAEFREKQRAYLANRQIKLTPNERKELFPRAELDVRAKKGSVQ